MIHSPINIRFHILLGMSVVIVFLLSSSKLSTAACYNVTPNKHCKIRSTIQYHKKYKQLDDKENIMSHLFPFTAFKHVNEHIRNMKANSRFY